MRMTLIAIVRAMPRLFLVTSVAAPMPVASAHAQAVATAARSYAATGSATAISTGALTSGLQGDPADSLYRTGQFYLRRDNFRSAAEIFRALPQRYPRSRLIADALYWESFSLYRLGGPDNLRAARATLERHQSQHRAASSRGDADVLLARVHAELARLGDEKSKEFIQRQASGEPGSGGGTGTGTGRGSGSSGTATGGTPGSCRSDDDDMRIVAINSIMQMDAEQAIPILREVLKKRGPCTEILRRKAVFVLAQTSAPEAADILLQVVTTDPDPAVRKEAVRWLGDVKGERTVSVLDSILRSTNDPAIRDAALFALSDHDSPRARQVIWRYAEDPRTPDDSRLKAIAYIGIHSGKADDAEFLIGLYPKLTDRKARQTIIRALGDIEVQASRDFLIRIIENPNEDIATRKDAMFWLQEAEAPTSVLLALEKKLDDPKLREHFVWVLSERKDEAATNRLLEIAKTHEDREMRKKAIFWLGQRNDPRVRQLLLDIINQ